MDRSVETTANFCHNLRFPDLSPAVVRDAKRRIIDTLGCGLGALHAEPSRIARRTALRAAVKPGASVMGCGHQTLPELAAFANGMAMRYLDANDSYPGGGGHPSDVVAAVLAATQAAKADGRTAIAATVVAYKTYLQFRKAVLDPAQHDDAARNRGFDHVLYTVVGSAMGAANAMGLTRDQTANALALSIAPYIPLYVTRRGNLSMWKAGAAPNAARNGVFAAVLAREGMTGPESAIEGVHGLRDLLGRFQLQAFPGNGETRGISLSSLKFHSAEYHAQSPITAALELPTQVAVEEIDKVIVHTYLHALNEIGAEKERWHPKTRETADHSMAFIVAAILVHGKFSDDIFSEDNLRHPKVHELVDRVEIREDPELTKTFPAASPCRIEVLTRSGQRRVAATDYPRGHILNPMTDDEINAKFRGFALRAMPADRVEVALERWWALENASDLDTLFDAVRSNTMEA